MTTQPIRRSQDTRSAFSTSVEKITSAALGLMAARANALTPYGKFTAEDIAVTVAQDPTGDTAFYLAQLIAWGIEYLMMFRRHPDMLEVFGGAA